MLPPPSYLLQVKVLNRCHISTDRQRAYQGGQHPQQCVPHGFFFVFRASPAVSEVSRMR